MSVIRVRYKLVKLVPILFTWSIIMSVCHTGPPYSVNVTDGMEVTFYCLLMSLDCEWRLNGTALSESYFTAGVSTSQTRIGVNGTIRHTLMIVATLTYDNTAIVCTCTSMNGESEEALLRVQGPLNAPSDLNSSRDYDMNTTTITWTPPPSLDLTDFDPDIVYCIEVVNITCGEGGEVLVSECGITEPVYQSRDIPLHYIYNITVTPMSNVEGAMNGTNTTLEEEFPILSQQTSVSKRDDSNVDVEVIMDITEHHNKPLPSFYSLLLTPVNTNDSKVEPTVKMKTSDSIVLAVINGIKEQMLLNYIVVAYTCGHYPLSNKSGLSTHLTQNISVSSLIAGEIGVTGYFLDSTSTSILVIVYSSTTVRYQLYSSTVNERDFRATVDNLEGGSYHVSVFTVENGVPLRQAATKPQSVYVSLVGSSSGVVQPTFLITYSLQSTSTGVCITCTFLESSTTDCVAVIHQRISQLNSSGLMNIESSHKFTRSGDTASGCIEGVNLEDRQVGVVEGRQVMQAPDHEPLCIGCTIASAVLAVISVLVVSILILIAIVCRKLYRKGFRSRSNTVANEQGLPDQPQSSAPPTPCDAENLCSLLHDICPKWEKLAKALSLDEDHIEDVNTGNETDEACLQEVLERYFDNGDFNHNWKEIVAILRKINENQLADKIYDLHVYPHEALLPGETQHATECATPTLSIGSPINDMPLERQTDLDQSGPLLLEKDTGYDSDLTSTGPEPESCTSPASAVEQQSDLQATDGINDEMNPEESQSDVMEPPSEVVVPKGSAHDDTVATGHCGQKIPTLSEEDMFRPNDGNADTLKPALIPSQGYMENKVSTLCN